MENNLMTVFTRIFHTQGDSLVELSAWIENVRNGQWKNEVENYRRLMAEGKKQEAASVKEQLPALVPAGNCLADVIPSVSPTAPAMPCSTWTRCRPTCSGTLLPG
mgnify:FL=1